MKQFDVIAVGELLIDFTPLENSASGKPVYEQNPGGAPANVVGLLAKWGRKTAFTGKVGSDFFGDFLRDTLAGLGIDCTGLTSTAQANTTLAFVKISEDGDRAFSFYRNPGADLLFSKDDIHLEQISAAKAIHFGSVSLTGGTSREATWYAVQQAKEKGKVISFDPNLRERLWNSLDEAKEQIVKGLSYADIVKVSEEELEFLTGNSNLEKASQEIMKNFSTKLLFVTLGAEGCFYRYQNGSGRVQGFSVDTIDTTGAGDAFFGAILYQLLERNLELEQLEKVDLEKMVEFANAAGALTTTAKGAISALPSYEQVEQLLKKG